MKISKNKEHAKNLVFSQFLCQTSSVFKVLHKSHCRYLNMALHLSTQFKQVHTGAEQIYIFRRSSHSCESNVCSMKETNLQAQRAQRMPHFFKVEAATFTYIEILKILDKEFTIQFKPFNEQGWSSTSILLASALHFTQAASKLSS